MKFILLILIVLLNISFQEKLISIDIQLNNDKTYAIKNIDNNLNFSFDANLNINILPQKIFHFIKNFFINNNKKKNCFSIKYKEYETFYCSKNIEKSDLINIKINLNFENSVKTMTFREIFSKKGNIYIFKFYSKPEISNIIIEKLGAINLRKLNDINETVEKNETDVIMNNNEKENEKDKNAQKSGIGWLGISLIILLSFIVIYVIYVGFRYYRRKKYQNPSFYYKITEEMFDDITPIE